MSDQASQQEKKYMTIMSILKYRIYAFIYLFIFLLRHESQAIRWSFQSVHGGGFQNTARAEQPARSENVCHLQRQVHTHEQSEPISSFSTVTAKRLSV